MSSQNKFRALKMVLPLIAIAAVSGAILATVYSATKEKIEYQKKQQMERAIFSILPQTKYIEEAAFDSRIIYNCKDEAGAVIGRAFTAGGPGYQDVIKVMVVTTNDLKQIKGIEILESVETPGLGAKIKESAFKGQFQNTSSNLKLSKEFSQKGKDETTVQAITGATISSQAVIDIINAKIIEIKELLKNEK